MKSFSFYFRLILILFCSVLFTCSKNLPANPTFLELNSPPFGNGMFNVCSMVIGLLNLYETGSVSGVSVNFKDQGVYYDPEYGLNWWEYYFEPIFLGNQIGTETKVTSIEDQCLLSGLCEFHLSRDSVSHLLKKYVRLKPQILSKLESIQNEKFMNAFMIGVHYRGTDKFTEAPKVPYKEVKNKIKKVMNRYSNKRCKIFIATDEQPFLQYILKHFPNAVYLEDNIRSTNGQPVHHHCLQNYKKGEEALLDCLLLSQCDLLIRTSSSLSLFSSFFNPDLEVINLNYRHGMQR